MFNRKLIWYVVLVNLLTSAGFAESLLLTLDINHAECPEVLTGELIGENLYFKRQDLTKCGLYPPVDEEVINLNQLSDIDLQIDRSLLKVLLTVPVSWFDSHAYQARNSPNGMNANVPETRYGVGINYDISGHHFGHQTVMSGLPELLMFTPYGIGKAGFLIKSKGEDRMTRLEASWVLENGERMERIRLGDGITSAPIWGGAARFTGIQWSTNFASQQNFIPFPQVSFRGESALPTAIDVLSKNTRVFQEQIKSGPYEIINLPAVTGAGLLNVQMVDVLGNRQVFTVPYYVSSELLKPGLSNFSYEIGMLRESFGLKSNDYSDPGLVMTHRRGITDFYTIGGHGEVSRNHLLGGIDQTILIGNLGTLSISAAAQKRRQRIQGLASFALERQADPISFGGRVTYTTGKFQDISMNSDFYRPQIAIQSFLSWVHEFWGGLTASFTSTKTAKTKHRRRPFQLLTLNYHKSLFNFCHLSFSVSHQFKDRKETSFLASLNIPLGSGRSTSLYQSKNRKGYRSTVSFQQNITGELGTGYRGRLSYESDHDFEYEAELTHKHDFGSFQVRTLRNEDNYYHQGHVSGALLFLNKSLFVTRKIIDSVALAQIPSFKNVEVYVNNISVGRTDASGELLLPTIPTFTRSEVRINEQDIPIASQLDHAKQDIFLPAQGAYVVSFSAKVDDGKVLRLTYEDNQPVEPGTTMTWSDGQETMVGYRGEVYRPIPTAPYKLTGTLSMDGKTCHIKLDPEEMNLLNDDLPTFMCRSSESVIHTQ